MANVIVSGAVGLRPSGLVMRLMRARAAVRQEILAFQGELLEQRSHFRRERALRGLDVSQLRDIGFNRNAC